MEHRTESETVPKPVYDVLLGSRPPESLRDEFPTMSIQVTGAQTALRRRLSGPSQLDALLENLCALGVRLLEVHRLPGPVSQEQTYEVRVDGEVGEPLLQHLSWSHQVVPEQTRVRFAAASNDLHQFLRACTERGASIQRVHMVDPARRRQPTYS